MQNMKKLLLSALFICVTVMEARMTNGIAMVVEGEPITIAEIKAVQTQLGVSKSEAKDMLILNRLQKAAMKDIVISEDEIDTRVTLIAKQNNLSLKAMQEEIKKQGLTWRKFREQIQTSLQKQKFFRSKIARTIPEPSDDELKIFYKNNITKFKMPSSITAIEYSASSSKAIQAFLKNPSQRNGIKSRTVVYKGADLTPQLMSMFAGVRLGSFTPAVNNGSAYVSFKITDQGNAVSKPFADVKNSVMSAWKSEQQAEAIKGYFEKMKRSAAIEIIRP
jgi:hypothetical protein